MILILVVALRTSACPKPHCLTATDYWTLYINESSISKCFTTFIVFSSCVAGSSSVSREHQDQELCVSRHAPRIQRPRTCSGCTRVISRDFMRRYPTTKSGSSVNPKIFSIILFLYTWPFHVCVCSRFPLVADAVRSCLPLKFANITSIEPVRARYARHGARCLYE